MAYEIPGFSFTLPAGVDLTGSLFRGVNIDANLKAVLPAAGGRIVGFVNNKPNTNEAATIVGSGIVQAEAGAAITAGADVQVDNVGRIVPLTTGVKVGVAFEAASGAGIIIACLLQNAAVDNPA